MLLVIFATQFTKSPQTMQWQSHYARILVINPHRPRQILRDTPHPICLILNGRSFLTQRRKDAEQQRFSGCFSRVEHVDRVEATIRRHPNHIQWIFYRRIRPFPKKRRERETPPSKSTRQTSCRYFTIILASGSAPRLSHLAQQSVQL